MRMAVIGANGREGRLVCAEAMRRGIAVTAIVRGLNGSPALDFFVKDLFDLTPHDLASFDVVVDAFGVWDEEDLPRHRTSLAHLCDILSGTPTRLLVVGGAGSLYVDPDHTTRLMDLPEFPEENLPLATCMAQALDDLRAREDVQWTYLSPAASFVPGLRRSGGYLLGGEELMLNEAGESVVGYADFAIAVVDEAERAEHLHERISVVRR